MTPADLCADLAIFTPVGSTSHLPAKRPGHYLGHAETCGQFAALSRTTLRRTRAELCWQNWLYSDGEHISSKLRY